MKKLFVGVVILLVGWVGWSVFDYHTNQPPEPHTAPSTNITQPKRVFTQEPHLAAVLQGWGVNDKTLDLSYGDSPNWEGEWASYNNGTILVNPDLTPDQEREMLGHEYLHHVWATKLPYQEQVALLSEINQLRSHPLIADRLAGPAYTNCDTFCQQNEVPPYACTLLPRETLPPNLQAYCNKYLPGVN